MESDKPPLTSKANRVFIKSRSVSIVPASEYTGTPVRYKDKVTGNKSVTHVIRDFGKDPENSFSCLRRERILFTVEVGGAG